jgi:hypothetical protein
MLSSGVSLLAMTRVLITGCRALASRLRSPNWPGAATVWVDAYGVTAGEPQPSPFWCEQVHEPIIWPEGRLR